MKDILALRRYIKKVIHESSVRNYNSMNTMPMDYTRYPEVSVSVDYITSKDKWMVGIKRQDAEKKEYRYFGAQEDAETWARIQADKLRAIIMNEVS